MNTYTGNSSSSATTRGWTGDRSLGPTGNVGSPGLKGPPIVVCPTVWCGHTDPIGAPGVEGPPGDNYIEEEKMQWRFVCVLIVDSDGRIPVASALLYGGEPYLTDMTDEEIFLALDLGTMLAQHNAVRETTLDEEETRKRGKDVYLPPIKIRDLAKQVVPIAYF